MSPNRPAVLLLLSLALGAPACTLPVTPPDTGTVSIAVADSPGYSFDNVWVTIRAVWFHELDTAPFDNTAGGWVRFTLDPPATLNLAAQPGGASVRTVWDNLALPVGTYRQMLLFVEPTESALTPSADADGLLFNNQVDAGSRRAALRVPNAGQGIRLAGTFRVDNAALLRLAIEFDIARDVLPFNRGVASEFLLQPGLRSFDLDDAGAIVGTIDAASAADNAARFEVMAEQADGSGGVRVVRRTAAVDNNTGRFVLYPLTAGHHNIVIRGAGYQTVIVKNVPATRGTTPSSAAPIAPAPAITMGRSSAGDYVVRGSADVNGALVRFHQTRANSLDPDPVPYEILARRVDPLSGTFDNASLPQGPLRVGAYRDGAALSLVSEAPSGGEGVFTASASSSVHDRGGFLTITVSRAVPFANELSVAIPSPGNANTIGGRLTVPATGIGALDNVFVFSTFGGTIVDSRGVGPVGQTTVPYPDLTFLPGGTPSAPRFGASYGVTAYGWTSSVFAVALPAGPADLQSGNDNVDITMTKVTVP